MAQDISADLKRGEGHLCGTWDKGHGKLGGRGSHRAKTTADGEFFGKSLGRQERVLKLPMPLALASG